MSGSEQPANLAAFNNTNYVKNNNCYTYALNTLVNPITNAMYGERGMDPGGVDGSSGLTYDSLAIENAATAIPQEVRDDCYDWGGSFNDFYLVNAETRVPNGYYKVALFVVDYGYGRDYHWFRQASDLSGQWAHKPGITDATATYEIDENTRSTIILPHQIAYHPDGYPTLVYEFVGYYAIKPPSAYAD